MRKMITFSDFFYIKLNETDIGQENKNLYEEIKIITAEKRITPFIGAGVSANLIPTWKQFLWENNINQDNSIFEDISNYLFEEAADRIKSVIGNSAWNKLLNQTFEINESIDDRLVPVVAMLPELFSNMIVTTNFDNILERVFDDHNKSFINIFTPENLINKDYNQYLKKGSLILVKLHGNISKISSIIFTKSQYDEFYSNEDFLTAAKDIFHRSIFLFLGCSLNIDRTLRLMQAILGSYRDEQHYALLELPENFEAFQKRADDLTKLGIKAFWYPEKQYSTIALFLKRLSRDLKGDGKIYKFDKNNNDVVFGRNEEIDLGIRKLYSEGELYVRGVSGIGKSTLCRYILEQIKNENNDNVFVREIYVPIKNYSNSFYETILQSLGYNFTNPQNSEELRSILINELKSLILKENCIIFYFDNADTIDAEEIISFFRSIENDNIFLIFSSIRMRDEKDLIISELSELSALNLFEYSAKRNVGNYERNKIKQFISKDLGMHTLSIKLAGINYLESIDDLMIRWKASKFQFSNYNISNYQRNLFAFCSLIYEKILTNLEPTYGSDTKSTLDFAWALFYILDDGISKDFLSVMDNIYYKKSHLSIIKMVTAFYQFSLVSIIDNKYKMPDLLKEFIQYIMKGKACKMAYEIIFETYILLSDKATNHNYRCRKLIFNEIKNIAIVLKHALENEDSLYDSKKCIEALLWLFPYRIEIFYDLINSIVDMIQKTCKLKLNDWIELILTFYTMKDRNESIDLKKYYMLEEYCVENKNLGALIKCRLEIISILVNRRKDNDSSNALELANKCMQLYDKELAHDLNFAKLNRWIGEIKKEESYFLVAIEESRRLRDQNYIRHFLRALGRFYYGRYTSLNDEQQNRVYLGKALMAYQEALIYNKKCHDRMGCANTYKMLSTILYEIDNSDRRILLYLSYAQKYAQADRYYLGVANCKRQLAEILIYKKKFKKSRLLLSEAKKIYEEQDNMYGQMNVICTQGILEKAYADNLKKVILKRDHYRLALEYFSTVLEFYQKNNLPEACQTIELLEQCKKSLCELTK